MRFKNNSIFFSPSDLITFMDSTFASHMERNLFEDNSYSELMDPQDSLLKNLQEKGFEHEDAILRSFISEGKNVSVIENTKSSSKLSQTRFAMKSGADIITQAYLEMDNFGGIADFLVKVPGKSYLGEYHYEVWDTKLSKKMKPYFAIQLCCYAEMLEIEQGVRPNKVAVVLGDKNIIYLKTKDYFSYYLTLKSNFIFFQDHWKLDIEPDPVETRNYGRWSQYAKNILLKRRHLSYR